AELSQRHFEIKAIVDQIRFSLANIVVNAGTAQAGAGKRVRNRRLWRDDAHTLGAAQPDRVRTQEIRVFLDTVREHAEEVANLLHQRIRNLAAESADLHHIGGQTGSAER